MFSKAEYVRMNWFIQSASCRWETCPDNRYFKEFNHSEFLKFLFPFPTPSLDMTNLGNRAEESQILFGVLPILKKGKRVHIQYEISYPRPDREERHRWNFSPSLWKAGVLYSLYKSDVHSLWSSQRPDLINSFQLKNSVAHSYTSVYFFFF